MKPINFEHSNKTLTPSQKPYGGDVREVVDLPVWTDGIHCVSCSKMSIRERISALIFGRTWIDLLSGGTQPPVYVQASKEYLKYENE